MVVTVTLSTKAAIWCCYTFSEFVIYCLYVTFFAHRYGIEGPVYLTPKGEKGAGEWYVDEQQQKIKKMDGSLSYSVLQTVKIHMEVVEPQPNRPKLQLTLI